MSKGHFILYNSNEKNFTSMGVLVLDNYIMNTTIKETMNENYTFEFEMFNSVAHLVGHRMYIKAPTRKGDELFRVRIIEKDMNNYGATYFYCTQVFFCDMEDNFIENLELLNVTGYAALNFMDTNTQYPHKFTFYSDISESNSTIILRKNFVSALIGDSEYSFVNTWGGELEVNKFSVKMMSKIGQDRGVRIRYRKNLTGLNAKTDYSSYCTRIMPLGYDDITIPEKYIDSAKMDPNHPIIRVVEFSNIKVKANAEDQEGYATIEEAESALRIAAQKLFTEGKLDEPESTYEIEFQELSSTIEYRDDYAVLENIFLGDTVEVYHEDLDISVSTRCVSYEYDPKTDRYISITLGNVISKFSSSSVKNQETILDKIESNEKDYQGKLDDAVEKLTNMINTGLTGHVVITDNEIMIMDTTDKDTAVEVWRYNINGFGYSNTGYNGPFIGLTKDGKLLVTEATANKFTAALINAGILQSVDGSSWFNLDDGTFSWANGSIVYDGTELTINVGGHNINDMLDATFNVLVNHEHQIIQLDSNYFPVNNGSYEFTFTVLKENNTTETPCLVTGITPHVSVDGISFKMNNNTCTMMVDKTKRLLNIKESFFDVTLEVLDYTLTKRLTWSVSVNGRDGEDGVNGAPGINGKDGVNSYFHIKYSEVPNPTSSSQMLETPSFYIGTYVDSIQTDSNDPTKYTWSRFRGIDGNDGEDGIPGVNGKDGITYYIHIKYSDDGKTFTANNGETPGKYLGQLVDTTKGDSLVFNAYTWKKIEGDAGTNASYVRISNNGQVFLKAKSATTFTPASITLTPVFTNATYSNWQYSVDNTSTWNTVTSGQNGLTISGNKLTVASTSALFTSTVKSILFKVNCTNGVSDTITLVRIEEGKDGVDGVDGSNGTNGKDGKGIKSVANYYLASSSSSGVTVSTSGWTTTVQNISTSKKYLWNYELITYTDNSTYTTIPTIIGVHGTNGTNGTNGVDGKGIKSITEYYVLSTTNTGVTTSTSGWSTTVPTLTPTNKYLWNYEKITYTDNSTTSTTPVIIGVYGDKGIDGVDGADGKDGATPNYNLVADSHNMGGVFSAAGGYKGDKTLVKDVDAQCGYHVECKCTTAGHGPHFPVFPKTSDRIGNTYTWSFWAKASVAKTSVTCGHECGGRMYINLTTSWQKFTKTWTYTDDTYYSFTFYANENWAVGEILYIKDFKIEMGDKATAWLPTVDEIKGVGIKNIVNYYLASSSSSGVTTSTSGWTETVQTISTSNKYLWNYELVTYSDDTTYSTPPMIIGVHGTNGTNGTNGKGIKSVTEYYLLSTNKTGITTSTTGWSTTVPTLTATNKYMWNYEKITYTDNSTTNTTPAIIGVYGDKGNDGANGKDGKGVNTITNYYLATSSSSGVTTSTSGWTTTVQSISTSKKYLWNYEVIAYTDGTNTTTSPTIIGVHGTNGTNGQNGADGKGISTITEYYLATSSSSGVTTSTSGWTTSVQSMTSTNKYLWNYEVIKYTDNSTTTGSPKIIGVYGDKGATGANAVNVLLSNESHTFAASSNGAAVAGNVTTNVIGYKGSTATACTVGTISGLPTGMTAKINNNGSTSASITFTVTTSLTTKAGTVTIPVTCGGVTVNKVLSYSLAVAGVNGTNGTNGTNAKLVKINATTNVFKSTDGGITFSPSKITIYHISQNVTFSKWQYSINGGSSWTDVTSGSNGLTISGNGLQIAVSSDLFTESVTAVTFKALSTVSNIYDTLTIYKLYDRTDINDAFEEMELTVSQSNTKWEAAFKNANANNMLLNSDAKTGTTDEWVDNGGGLNVYKANAFPFYGSIEYYFYTTFPYGMRYAHDIPLEPNTDYVYEGYIFTNTDLTGTSVTPLHFWIWTGDTPTSTRLCTIVDYRQTMTKGRFVKCYIHFKTNNVTEALHGRFFIYHTGTSSSIGVKRMSLKKGTIESEWTQHPNEVKSIVTSIDKDGVKVKHSEAGTYTQMDSNGFSIRESGTDEALAWLSSKQQWTELKVDKLFASNVENVYVGDGNLYVNHSATVAGDGTADAPFNSFRQLKEYLEATPVINKNLSITVMDPGDEINEQLNLQNLGGVGDIKITLEDTVIIRSPGDQQACIQLEKMPTKWVCIAGGREFGSATTGAVLCDNPNNSAGGHGIKASEIGRLEVDALSIACKNWGIKVDCTNLFTWHCDFGKCYTAIELRYQSMYYSSDDVGSNTKFAVLKSGSLMYFGVGTVIPQGSIDRTNGIAYRYASLKATASTRYSIANPDAPLGSQTHTYTYHWTSHKSYNHDLGNWSEDDCKQGYWGHGVMSGHMFFDLTTIRKQMAGTVINSNTITLTRSNTGGNSGEVHIYLHGSTCSSASGTPSYGNSIYLGALALGETKTFTLNVNLVQDLVSGRFNSIAMYVSGNDSNYYINIVDASITLKVLK